MFTLINTVTTLLSVIPLATSSSLLEDLYTSLLKTYEPNVRPRINPRQAVDVSVSYNLMSVEQVDETTQTLVSAGFLEIEWKDDNLFWNTTRYGGIGSLTVPWEAIWKPDLMVVNSVEDFGSLASPGGHLRVYSNGVVLWFMGTKQKTKCKLDMAKYPFDRQSCSLRTIQWSSFKDEVNYTSGQIGMEESLFLTNSQWTTEIGAVETIIHDYPNQGEIIQQTEFKFIFTFHRKYLYCVVTNIIPVMLLSLLNLGVFLLPAESGEKVSLSVSIVLSYAVFLTVINESLPESSDNFSIFGVYLLTMLFLKVMTTLSTIVVIKLYHTKPNRQILRPVEDKQEQVPGSTGGLSESVNRLCFRLCLVFTFVITLVCFSLMIL